MAGRTTDAPVPLDVDPVGVCSRGTPDPVLIGRTSVVGHTVELEREHAGLVRDGAAHSGAILWRNKRPLIGGVGIA